jgi:AcrR family transcriptional regulator
MKDAGLTNGAFYAHFESKDSLVAAAIADQLHAQHANLVAQAEPGPAGLEQICAGTCRPSNGTTSSMDAPTPPCSTRSGPWFRVDPRYARIRPTPRIEDMSMPDAPLPRAPKIAGCRTRGGGPSMGSDA